MEVIKKNKTPWIILGVLLVLGVIGFILRGFWHPYQVPTGSMAPAIPERSYVFVNDWAYSSIGDVRRGDVIVFDAPPSAYEDRGGIKSTYVFRVIGLPGDTVSFDEQGQFVVNGEALETIERGAKVYEKQEEKAYEVLFGRCRVVDQMKVKNDSFFVAGDNRVNAWDSRYWGLVPFDLVKGRARVE